MTGNRRFPLLPAGVAIAIAIAALCYALGLPGDFVFDDTSNLLDNKQIQLTQLDAQSIWAATVSGGAGPLLRPLSMLSFALSFYLADGFHPGAFKLVNIGIHLFNGLALYGLLALILAAVAENQKGKNRPRHYTWLPLAVMAGWLLHPLGLTSVLYVVQRMNSLATLFTIGGLICYVHGRRQLNLGQDLRGLAWVVGGILAFGTLATLSKENGVLLPVYALVIETTIFRFQTPSPRTQRILFGLFTILIALPLVLGVVFFTLHPEWLADRYGIRSFTLTQRLLTEPRIIWLYIKWILIPNNAELGLFHDDISASTNLWTPMTTSAAIAGLMCLLAIAFWARRRAPLVAFGILFFLAGHTLESTFLPLELVFEHRNYLPMAGILVILFDWLLSPNLLPALSRLGVVTVAVFLILIAAITANRALQWKDESASILVTAEQHPNSARANYHAGRLYGRLLSLSKADQNLYQNAKIHFLRSAALDPRSTDGLFGLVILDSEAGHKPDTAIIAELRKRLRISFVSSLSFSAMKIVAAADGEGRPMLPHRDIEDLFDAALDNPLLSPETKAMFLSQFSAYLGNQRHSWKEAILLAAKAVETAPKEPVFNIDMANLFLAIGQYDAAREQIQIAQKKDHIGRFGPDISALEQTITQHDSQKAKQAG